MNFTDRNIATALSEAEHKMYGAVAAKDWKAFDELQARYPESRQKLVAWGFISDENPPVARDPQQTLRDRVSEHLKAAIDHIGLVATMPELSRDMIREYRQGLLRAGGSSAYLAEPETVNARLQDAVADARWEILAAQPGGARKPEVLEAAMARDIAALDRGVDLRTIYLESVREHPGTAKYAQKMSARTDGRSAQYRTLPGDFERVIIVDREIAFISDHIVENSPPHAAWLVTDPPVVAVLARMFDAKWRRAQPWYGELRAKTGAAVDTVSGTGGVRTTAYQRTLLRLLCTGESQPAAARQMGVSQRTMEKEIATLKEAFGARTLAQLIFNFSRSPDADMDDSAADSDGRPRSAVA